MTVAAEVRLFSSHFQREKLFVSVVCADVCCCLVEGWGKTPVAGWFFYWIDLFLGGGGGVRTVDSGASPTCVSADPRSVWLKDCSDSCSLRKRLNDDDEGGVHTTLTAESFQLFFAL